MNYTINYPSGGNGQITGNNLPGVSQGPRTFVITPPGQNSQNGGTGNISSNNNQTTVPIIMQVGGVNAPLYYTYQSSDGIVNSNIPSTRNDGQVVFSSVSPGQPGIKILKPNASSPTVLSMNITPENKPNAARSLGDLFSMHPISGIGNQSAVVVNNSIQGNGNQGNSDLVSMISSLQAAGLQVVKTSQAGSNNGLPVSVISNPQQSGMQVVENCTEKTLTLPVTKSSMEEAHFIADSKIVGVPNSSVSVEKIYQIVDNAANVALVTGDINGKRESSVMPAVGNNVSTFDTTM